MGVCFGHCVSWEEVHAVQIPRASQDVMAPFSFRRPMAMWLRTKRNLSARRAQPEHLPRMRPRWDLCPFIGVLRQLGTSQQTQEWREKNQSVMLVQLKFCLQGWSLVLVFQINP